MKSIRRIVSGLLVLCMVISMLPATAWAEETVPAETAEEMPAGVVATTAAVESIETVETAAETVESVAEEDPSEADLETEVEDTQPETTEATIVEEDNIVASGTCGDNLTWELDDAGILSISGTGFLGDYGDDRPEWYDYCDQILSVDVQSGVTGIGEYAFAGHTNATRITLPGSVSYIGNYAFASCNNLNSVTILDGDETDAEVTFEYDDNGCFVFDGCANLTNVSLGNSVKNIPDGLFLDCKSLENVVVSDKLTSIGDGAFAGSGLWEISLPDSLREIGAYAFQNCDNLKEITLPGGVKTVGAVVFGGCDSLISFTVEDCGDALADTVFYDGSTFYECYNLTNVYLGNSVKRIADQMFEGCEALEKVTFSDYLQEIGDEAFLYCRNVHSISLPSTVTSIGDRAFAACVNLSSFTIADSSDPLAETIFVGEDGDATAFEGCIGLTNISLGNTVKFIPNHLFFECEALERIEFWDELSSIGNYAFSGCKSLREITLPGSVKNIGVYAFNGCSSLKAFSIENSDNLFLETVFTDSEDYMGTFYECSSLETVYLGNTVKTIPSYMFCCCEALQSITLNSVTEIRESAFDSCGTFEIEFQGDAPEFAEDVFNGDIVTAYYPVDNTNWTEEVMQRDYGGEVTWTPYVSEDHVHTYTAVVTEATCTEGGFTTYTCICGGSYVADETDALGHMEVVDAAVASTCTETGLTEGSHCSVCGEVLVEQETVEATGHNFVDKVCTVCGEWDALAHGICGENLTWVLDHDGSLTISGTGAMDSYTSSTTVPWADYRDNIASIVLEDGVTSIGKYAFYRCINATSVQIPGSVTVIGDEAFEFCSALQHIEIPEGVVTIGMVSFASCHALVSITLPDGLETIGDMAFVNCYALEEIVIPEGVTYLGGGMFDDCRSLKNVTIPATVTTFGDGLFSQCGSLETAVIPEGITSLGRYTFYDCSSLVSVSIPVSMESIADSVFHGCDLLTDIYYAGTKAEWIEITVGSDNDPLLNATIHCAGSDNHDHVYTAVVTEPTCTTGGYTTYTCVCGESYVGDETEALGHTEVVDVAVAPTCTETGLTEGCHCSVCGEILISQEETPVTDHSFVNECCEYCRIIGGSCWKNLIWILDVEGTLTISGDYMVEDYPTYGYACPYPWSNYGNLIKTVVIKAGVRNIGDNAFYECAGLTSISIPDSVTYIGSAAFAGCKSLTNVIIPDSVTSISNSTFSRCKGLTSVTIPDSITSIGISAFTYCTSLSSVTIPDSVTSIGDNAFSFCTSLTNITIPNSVTSIGSHVFQECTSLARVMLPEGITGIGDYTFHNCTSLTNVDIPDNVTNIGYRAFYNCTGLTSVTIPASATIISEDAFYICSNLKEVHITDLATWCGVSFGNSFSNPTQYAHDLILNGEVVTSLLIPENVTSIGNYAFYKCKSITNVDFIGNVTSIGYQAFYNCYGLTRVTIPASVSIIGEDAFYLCSNLEEVHITDLEAWCSISFINASSSPGYYAKRLILNGEVITDLVIPEGVTSIGNYAFYDCTSLISVTIPDSVTSIGDSTFYGCTSLTNVMIPDSVTSMGSWVFMCCTSLTSVIIPDSVTSIGDRTFMHCTSLTSVTIPNSVTSIGDYSFSNCSAITDVYYSGSEEQWNAISIGSYNTYLTNATIHYNSTGPESEADEFSTPVRLFTSWDAENQIAYFDNDPIQGYQVTEETDSTFLSIVDSLVGQYVLVDSVPLSDGSIGHDTLISIRDVSTKSGTVEAADESSATIDGVTYPSVISMKLEHEDGSWTELVDLTRYIGKEVLYHICDGELVGIELMTDELKPYGSVVEVRYFRAWDAETGIAQFGNFDITIATADYLTEKSFENNLDALLGQYVLVKVSEVNSWSGTLDCIKPVVSRIDTVEGVVSLCHLYEDTVVTTEPLQKIHGVLTGWNSETRSVSIEPYDSDSNVSYILSSIAPEESLTFLNKYSSGGVTIATDIWCLYDREGFAYAVYPHVVSDGTFSFLSSMKIDGKEVVFDYTYHYDESWFAEPATKYQHDLAKMSLRVAMAAGDIRCAAGYENTSGYDNLQSLMSDLGFVNHRFCYPHSTSESHYDNIGYGIGSKTILDEYGEECTLIMIGVRGSGYGAEWGGNFRIGSQIVEHEGFNIAAQEVLRGLTKYISDNADKVYPRVKIWISGYSRAGATTNLVAANLIDGYISQIEAKDVYAFCFECPQNTTYSRCGDTRYSNIVNIVNAIDLVPKLAMSAWGFSRFGTTYYLPYHEYESEDYESLKVQMREEYRSILAYQSGRNISVDSAYQEIYGQSSAFDDMVLLLAYLFENRDIYTREYQSTIMDAIALLMVNANVDFDIYEMVIALSNLLDNNFGFILKRGITLTEICTKFLPNTEAMSTYEYAHYMELCLAWMDSLDGLNKMEGDVSYRRIFVNCPVDVSVYSETGTLVAKIKDDIVQDIDNGIVAKIDSDGQKIIFLSPNRKYDLQLSATADGSMTYTVTDYNLDRSKTERVVSYQEIVLNEGDVLYSTIDALDTDSSAEYPLVLSDGSDAIPTIVVSGDNVKEYRVNVLYEDGGTATGGGKYLPGEYAKISASPEKGYVFEGWYVNDICVSEELEYRFLISADTTITARFVSIDDCVIAMQEYLVIQVGQTVQPEVQVHPRTLAEKITWAVESDDRIVDVDETGMVTAYSEGTAYVIAAVYVGDTVLEAYCRVDVAETEYVEEAEKIILDGIQLSTTKLTTKLYSTDYAQLDILLKLPQNYAAAASASSFMPENRGVAIESAQFTDETISKLFELIPLDDRTVAIVPTDAALADAQTVQSKYVSAVTVTVQGETYTSEETLTLTVKKTLPKLKTAIPAFNNFWSGQTQEIVITGATVTGISCENLPDWLSLNGTTLTLKENVPAKGGSAKLTLLVETEEWAVPVETTLAVKCNYKAPGLKLSASSIQLARADSDGVKLQLLSKDKKLTLSDLGVDGISAPDGYVVSDYNLEDGTFLIKAESGFQPGKISLVVGFNNTSETVAIPLTVKVIPVTLKLAPNSITLNSGTGDSAAVTVTATPADYRLTAPNIRLLDAAKQDKTDSGELKLSYENGRLNISTTDLTPDNAKYTLYISAEGGKEAALKISTTNAEPTLKLKAAGNLDLSFPDRKISLNTTFKNHSGGNLKAVDYTVTESSGKTILDDDSKAILLIKDGANLYVQLKETSGINIKNTYTLNLKLTLADDSVLESSVKIPVKQTAVNLKLSASKLTLNKAVNDKASVTVTCSTKDYFFIRPVWQLLDSKGKESAEGKLDIQWVGCKLHIAVNDNTEFGASYKLMVSAEEGAKATALTVTIPAKAKSTVTGSLKTTGNLDVIRDGTALTITPTWKNCNDADCTEELKVFCGDEDVTDRFVITEENGKYVLTRGENLDHSRKFTAILTATFANGTTATASGALKLKMGSAKLTVGVDSTTLFANDKNSRVSISFTSADSTLNKVAKVTLDPKQENQFEIFDYGNGQYAIGFKDGNVPAKLTSANIPLNIWLEGNETAKANANLKVKISIVR